MNTMDEIWLRTTRDLLDLGTETNSRVGKTKELLAHEFTLEDPRACFLFNPVRKLSPSYAAAELTWYLLGLSDVTFLLPYAPSYSRFAEADGKAHGAYGPRLHLEVLIDHLRASPNSRQAVIPIFNIRDLMMSQTVKDVPCTLSLQFLIRSGRLHLITTMRSNDAWLGLPYDVFCFCHLQILVANSLGVELGWYHHRVGSMHLYEKDWEKASELPNTFTVEPFGYNSLGFDQSRLSTLTLYESSNRLRNACADSAMDALGGHSVYAMLAIMMASKFSEINGCWNKTLSKYVENLA